MSGDQAVPFQPQENSVHNLRNKLLAGGAVLILAAIGTLMNSKQAAAQNQGNTTTVSGTVAATQSGTWNVGLMSGASVHVGNTVTDPVRVRNVNDAIQPFQVAVDCSNFDPSLNFCGGVFHFSVPMGKRAVIEYFSGIVSVPVGIVITPALNVSIGGQGVDHQLPTTPPAYGTGARGSISWGQQVRLYADPGTLIVGEANASAPAIITGGFTISGYLVDVPFAP
jgi:hypothetical protein